MMKMNNNSINIPIHKPKHKHKHIKYKNNIKYYIHIHTIITNIALSYSAIKVDFERYGRSWSETLNMRLIGIVGNTAAHWNMSLEERMAWNNDQQVSGGDGDVDDEDNI
eukprot:212713_1